MESVKTVPPTVESGMSFIDMPSYYEYYKAETVLGKALKELWCDKYYLSIKVCCYGRSRVNMGLFPQAHHGKCL